MRRIISTDSYRLKFSAERVFNAVSDVSVYKDWWSRKVKIKVLNMTEELAGSRVEIRASGGWFRCEIVSVMRNSEVRVKYYEGVQTGEGIWNLEKAGDEETNLTYSINLEPNGIIPGVLSNFINFSRIHSNAMKEMFAGLEKYLQSGKQL